MSYRNLPDNTEIKSAMERCVSKVKAQGKVKNVYAICYSAITKNHTVRNTIAKYKKK